MKHIQGINHRYYKSRRFGGCYCNIIVKVDSRQINTNWNIETVFHIQMIGQNQCLVTRSADGNVEKSNSGCWMEFKMAQPLWRSLWHIEEIKLHPIYPIKKLLNKKQGNLCNNVHWSTDSYKLQRKCASEEKWINWFSHSKEYYTAVKMNKVDSHIIKRHKESKRGEMGMRF